MQAGIGTPVLGDRLRGRECDAGAEDRRMKILARCANSPLLLAVRAGSLFHFSSELFFFGRASMREVHRCCMDTLVCLCINARGCECRR